MLNTTQFPTELAFPNVDRTSAKFAQSAASVALYQTRKEDSASGCSAQKSRNRLSAMTTTRHLAWEDEPAHGYDNSQFAKLQVDAMPPLSEPST
jgi:hypothetical protein